MAKIIFETSEEVILSFLEQNVQSIQVEKPLDQTGIADYFGMSLEWVRRTSKKENWPIHKLGGTKFYLVSEILKQSKQYENQNESIHG
jgi:hypothetical protein